jgi:ribosomal protein S18 acetylase RimI-like enzyme
MPDNVIIREGLPQDAAAIAVFMIRLARETEDIKLNPSAVEQGVKAVLADASKGRYFVATVDGAVAACLLITHEWSDWRNGDMWWIQSVYVHADHRRKGLFKQLYARVLEEAQANEVRAIRLYVEKHNDRAKKTYASLGFGTTEYDVLEVTP